jgi:hypothetical protein
MRANLPAQAVAVDTLKALASATDKHHAQNACLSYLGTAITTRVELNAFIAQLRATARDKLGDGVN